MPKKCALFHTGSIKLHNWDPSPGAGAGPGNEDKTERWRARDSEPGQYGLAKEERMRRPLPLPPSAEGACAGPLISAESPADFVRI
jgi:hypothetical protein